ncbi:MAG: hypothetical protein DMF22_04040 [Verrucomicrobia bacterium]|nr:MAG: hypothetical protein DMF22_04040 [Verrucomicrobiota bacterium]
MLPAKKFLLKTSGACSSQSHARQPQSRPRALDRETMDPARPSDPDPSDPFSPERADHAILETIEIGTEGEDCDECVRKLRAPLKKVKGVKDVKIDLRHERIIVTFDARKTHALDLHDAILKSGYKPGRLAEE